jgi:acetyl/propionyl-CoA carboxylase alpha subunit
MIAKLIAHGPTREAAIAGLAEACGEVEVWPVATNAGFLTRLLEHPDFIAGEVATSFIERRQAALVEPPPPSAAALSAAALTALARAGVGEAASPWRALTGFRLNAPSETRVGLFLDGARLDIDLPEAATPDRAVLAGDEGEVVVFEGGEAIAFSTRPPEGVAQGTASDGQILSPMPGRVVTVSVKAGQAVARGQALLTLEAMKMEHALVAPFDGRVEMVAVKVGDQVSEGVAVAKLAPAS